MSTLTCRSPSVLGALGLCLAIGACKEDPTVPKLFDETGVWSVIRYDLEGGGQLTDIVNSSRRDAFMLSFDPQERVVTAASCIEPDGSPPGLTPDDSPCLLSSGTTEWTCRCFGYDFVREEMLWREFNAGEMPPVVSLSASDEPAGGGGSGTTGDGGGTGDAGSAEDHRVNVAEIPDISSTYDFRPLPEDLFGSDGTVSRYIMQARASSVFDIVYNDPNRPTCTPCVP